MRVRLAIAAVVATGVTGTGGVTGGAQTTERLTIRGQPQVLRTYGARGAPPVIVSSGDGGWIHLGPHIAQMLAAHGWFVVGFDVRAYLGGFTTGRSAVRSEDEPADYRQLVEFAARGGVARPILVGVSEGAALSVLAAADPGARAVIAGVVGVGLPDTAELGWRWRDVVIYFTHGVPNEPTFRTSDVAARVSPLPLAMIQSTRDEFVPAAEARRVFDAAKDPKTLWFVEASDHRFSDNLAAFDRQLLDALAWIGRRGSARGHPEP